jgi:hypothetical protein
MVGNGDHNLSKISQAQKTKHHFFSHMLMIIIITIMKMEHECKRGFWGAVVSGRMERYQTWYQKV